MSIGMMSEGTKALVYSTVNSGPDLLEPEASLLRVRVIIAPCSAPAPVGLVGCGCRSTSWQSALRVLGELLRGHRELVHIGIHGPANGPIVRRAIPPRGLKGRVEGPGAGIG